MNRCKCDIWQPCGAKPLKVVQPLPTGPGEPAGSGGAMAALICPYSEEGKALLASDPKKYRIEADPDTPTVDA